MSILQALKRSLLCLGLGAALPSVRAADSTAVLSAGFIYPLEGRPTPECHASTLAELPDGRLLAAWFGGRHEKNPDVGIWVSRQEGDVWSRPVEVVNGIQYTEANGTVIRHPCWNPVLFQPAAGPLLLFYKVGPSPSTWWGMLTTSADGGRTWSEPRRLPEGILGPVKNKPVQLANGDLLCPTSSEHDGWRVHFEWTPDLGKTWFRTPPLNDGRTIGAIQPSVLLHPGGRLQALGRSRQGRLWESWSSDQGRTWTELTLLEVPNPNSGTDAVTLKDGRHLLVYNPVPRGRSPLALAVSTDGREWRDVATLEDQPGEYSYPAVIQGADGRVQVAYTWKRQTVKQVTLDPAKF